MNRIVEILMNRDGLSEDEAQAVFNEAKSEITQAAESGSYEEAEDLMCEMLGLEMDYIFDIL